MNNLIYGKDETQGVVSVEVDNGTATLFREGQPEIKTPAPYWILYSKPYSPKLKRLDGESHYKYYIEYDSEAKWRETLNMSRAKGYDYYVCWDPVEAFLMRTGVTYHKGMRIEDVSVLSFDIETTGVTHDENSRVLLISNTFRRGSVIERKLFSIDDYATQPQLISQWIEWVREKDPSVVTGHNVLSFDLPYLEHCKTVENWPEKNPGLALGRDGSTAKFNERPSEFRKDGSQSYTYHDVHIYGREIVDTFFLAMAYDATEKKYESYGLKQIIKQEGLERPGRAHYDAATIKENWGNASERAKIKAYAIDDADDALKLFDKMVPAYFYFSQSVPRPFQRMINGATNTGGQVNAMLMRAYLQDGHSVPKADQIEPYEGGISYGNPGVYKHVVKWDVTSMYPSIIREHKVYDPAKDPKAYFLTLVDTFYLNRLEYKAKHAETKDPYYKGMSDAGKIFVNSAYGALGANGINFNKRELADFVTREGRNILSAGTEWGTAKGYPIVNADTDSFSYSLKKKPTKKELTSQLEELNSLFPEKIRWAADGVYKSVLVVAAKNYALQDYDGKVTIKGASLKATMKEKALQKFNRSAIDLLLAGQKDRLPLLYLEYVRQIVNLEDINEWCFKKTVTKSVLNPERTNERRVLDALGENVSEGDKVYMFFKTETELCLREKFSGQYCVLTLLGKLYKTLEVFDSVVDCSLFPDLSIGRNEDLISLIAS